MLRKRIVPDEAAPPLAASIGRDIPALATVLVTSEACGHPIDCAFDGVRGRGASRWIAGQTGEQTLTLAFDAPLSIRKVVVEVEERAVARTQEIALAVSEDDGHSYRELLRQEYNFSPPGTTFEHEEWSLDIPAATHLRFRIKPDKGGNPCRATLTTVAVE